MRYLFASLLMISFMSPVAAQTTPQATIAEVESETPSPAPEIPPMMPEQIIAPTNMGRYARILFVMDVSGSMTTERLTTAQQVTSVFASDGFLAGVITFNGGFTEWVGVPRHEHSEEEDCGTSCVHEGWAELPRYQDVLTAYLTQIDKGGTTAPQSALTRAIERATPDTLVVFVTDGEFNGGAVVQAIDQAQNVRRARLGDPEAPDVPVLSWTVVPEPTDAMRQVGRRGGGGLWRASPEPQLGPF